MDLVIYIALLIIGIIVATVPKILAEEFKAWAPTLAGRITDWAVRHLSEEDRGRCHEEWHGHLEQTPGYCAKIAAAFGFVLAGRAISAERAKALVSKSAPASASSSSLRAKYRRLRSEAISTLERRAERKRLLKEAVLIGVIEELIEEGEADGDGIAISHAVLDEASHSSEKKVS